MSCVHPQPSLAGKPDAGRPPFRRERPFAWSEGDGPCLGTFDARSPTHESAYVRVTGIGEFREEAGNRTFPLAREAPPERKMQRRRTISDAALVEPVERGESGLLELRNPGLGSLERATHRRGVAG